MFVQKLYLKNFRNFESCSFSFDDAAHILVGPNGSGKTSVLEALFFCITASSFRTRKTNELVRFHQRGFFIEASFSKDAINHTVSVTYDKNKRHVTLDGIACARAAELLGVIPGVACTPEDIELIIGAPSERRRFLDLQLAQVDPQYVYHLRRYHRALKQRNALLKKKQEKVLFCFEAELAESGAYLIIKRKKALEFLSVKTAYFFQKLIGNSELSATIRYDTECIDDDPKAYLLDAYKKKRPQEMEYGLTFTGPHRDDLDIRFGKKTAREYASIGQKRLIAHAMKLAEWHFLQKELDEDPLMIVDDFATSLDEEKSALFTKELQQLGQVFLSSTRMPKIIFEDKKVVETVI